MGFMDFPVPKEKRSYLPRQEILDFLNQYADEFGLRPLMKFNSMVTDISPLENDRWQVTYVNKPTKEIIVDKYDAVMICNGHYNDPVIPKIEGQDKFTGKIEHSCTYRCPEPYEGKRVLVVGAGPSGLDVTLHMARVAETVAFSHHSEEARNSPFPKNVQQKPDIKRIISSDEVEFVDDTCCGFDVIIFCTGYNYSFPFLNESCGIRIDDNYIQPLYKHMINICKPTMCFIGVPFNVCTFMMFDLQAHYFSKVLDGSLRLPSTEEMEIETKKDMDARWAKGYTKRQAHMMGDIQEAYYEELSEGAETFTIAPVYVKLRNLSVENLYKNLLNFREDEYQILDDDNYIKVA
nr:senecionine N-oxygenase-like [Leptinotarsa decemlineata]